MTTAITRPRDDRRWLPIINKSTEEIPAYGIVVLGKATLEADGLVCYEAHRPRQLGRYAANSSRPVAVDGFGVATVDWPAMVALKSSEDDPEISNWGVDDESWELAESSTGGIDDSLTGFHTWGLTVDRDQVKRTLVSYDQPMSAMCQLTESSAASSGGSSDPGVQCWVRYAYWVGSSSGSTRRIKVSNSWMIPAEEVGEQGTISKMREAIAGYFDALDDGKGGWQFTGAECEPVGQGF